MYTRIHVFKFPNKVGRDSFRFFCINYTDKLFKEGLNFSLFINVSDTHLHYLTVWKSKKRGNKISPSDIDKFIKGNKWLSKRIHYNYTESKKYKQDLQEI